MSPLVASAGEPKQAAKEDGERVGEAAEQEADGSADAGSEMADRCPRAGPSTQTGSQAAALCCLGAATAGTALASLCLVQMLRDLEGSVQRLADGAAMQAVALSGLATAVRELRTVNGAAASLEDCESASAAAESAACRAAGFRNRVPGDDDYYYGAWPRSGRGGGGVYDTRRPSIWDYGVEGEDEEDPLSFGARARVGAGRGGGGSRRRGWWDAQDRASPSGAPSAGGRGGPSPALYDRGADSWVRRGSSYYGYDYYDRPSFDLGSDDYGAYDYGATSYTGDGLLGSSLYGPGSSSYSYSVPRYLSGGVKRGLRKHFRNRTRAVEAELRRVEAEAEEELERRSNSTPAAPSRGSAASAAWRIPRVLHQTWKTTELPSKFEEHISSWRRLHPEWRFEFWDDARCRALMHERFPKYAREYDRMSGIKRADVARIAVLHVEGGVYADIDVEATRSFEPLLLAAESARQGVLLGEENFVHSVLLEQRSAWLVSNAVMASARAHPFWLAVLGEIFSRMWCGDDPVQCTGPRLVDRLSWEYVRREQSCGAHGCIARLPFDYFSPHIARWNAHNMVRECRGRDGAFSRSSYWRGSSKLAKRACRSLERALQYPAALRTRQTFAVHHWQCSWCRQDDTLRPTVQLADIIYRLGNESLRLARRAHRRARGRRRAAAPPA